MHIIQAHQKKSQAPYSSIVSFGNEFDEIDTDAKRVNTFIKGIGMFTERVDS